MSLLSLHPAQGEAEEGGGGDDDEQFGEPVDDSTGNQQRDPDISGDWVVFEEFIDSAWEAVAKNIVTGQRWQLTADSNGDHYSVRVGGTRAIYIDQSSGGQDVVWADLSTGESTKLTSDSDVQSSADTDGERAVWYNNDENNIMLHDFSSGVTSAITSSLFSDPLVVGASLSLTGIKSLAISGDLIGWLRSYWDDSCSVCDPNDPIWIDQFYYHIISSDFTRFLWRHQGDTFGHINTDGDNIVYSVAPLFPQFPGPTRAHTSEIFVNGIAANDFMQLTDDSVAQVWPDVSGGVVVFQDNSETDNGDIAIYDISSERKKILTDGESARATPAISGDVVVWADWGEDVSADHPLIYFGEF